MLFSGDQFQWRYSRSGNLCLYYGLLTVAPCSHVHSYQSSWKISTLMTGHKFRNASNYLPHYAVSHPSSQPECPPSLKFQLSYKISESYTRFSYYLFQYNMLGLVCGWMASKPTFRGEDPRKDDLAIQPPDEAVRSRILYWIQPSRKL